METISETADAAAQTCEIRMKGPGIPDPRALADHIERKMRVGATLRGIEIKAVGRLTERDDGLYLEISGTKETIRLAALRRKVQWDIPAGREQEATPAEKNAFERLRGSRKNELVLVTGPLVRPVGEEPMVLEVRSFGPAPTRRTAPPRSPSGP
ncbi:MAG: hypothetical protein SFU56_04325 [Capsulimonadales bacterium]|nr:hypothetical protein [Capsulimonadales bacterium]